MATEQAKLCEICQQRPGNKCKQCVMWVCRICSKQNKHLCRTATTILDIESERNLFATLYIKQADIDNLKQKEEANLRKIIQDHQIQITDLTMKYQEELDQHNVEFNKLQDEHIKYIEETNADIDIYKQQIKQYKDKAIELQLQLDQLNIKENVDCDHDEEPPPKLTARKKTVVKKKAIKK